MLDMFVAKEGKRPVIIALVIFILFYIIDCVFISFISFISFVAALFLFYIYRFKSIDTSFLKDNEIYSPISGKVILIDNIDSKKVITIDVNLFDLHILRSPKTSEIKIFQKKGLNLPLNSYKSKKLNEQTLIEYDNFTMELFSSLCNPSIKLEKKSKFIKGEKIGIFLHGQIKLAFEEKANIEVNVGDKVISGETLISK